MNNVNPIFQTILSNQLSVTEIPMETDDLLRCHLEDEAKARWNCTQCKHYVWGNNCGPHLCSIDVLRQPECDCFESMEEYDPADDECEEERLGE